MININFTNIDNAKLIGRLLPFWARGKNISLLLQAILSPICSIHKTFQLWALERYIECHITAQKPSLEWYLKYCLKSRFLNIDDVFVIECEEEEAVTNIYAPDVVDTINYNHEDYERDIKYIVSKFMINFNQINIIIQKQM